MALFCVMNRLKTTVAKTKELPVNSLKYLFWKYLDNYLCNSNPQRWFLVFPKYLPLQKRTEHGKLFWIQSFLVGKAEKHLTWVSKQKDCPRKDRITLKTLWPDTQRYSHCNFYLNTRDPQCSLRKVRRLEKLVHQLQPAQRNASNNTACNPN